jgi:phosphopantothenoylcysteine synthetase/decarboxylase
MTAGPPQSLCVVVCAAGPAPHVGTLMGLATRAGWVVRVVATPAAVSFLDLPALAEASGTPVRSDYATPGQPWAYLSVADAVVVAPATYNTVCKLAAGINDTYALNVVAEAIGRGTPVAILPFVNAALAARRPFRMAVESLRGEGVRLLFGPGEWTPHPPGTGDTHLASFPWARVLEAVQP